MVQVPRQEPRMVKLGHTSGVACDAAVADEDGPVRGIMVPLPDDGIADPYAGDVRVAAKYGSDVAEPHRRRHARTMRLRAGEQDVHEAVGYWLLLGITEVQNQFGVDVVDGAKADSKAIQLREGRAEAVRPAEERHPRPSARRDGRVARNACGDVLRGSKTRSSTHRLMIRGLKRQRRKVKRRQPHKQIDGFIGPPKEAADEPMVHIDSE
ncbi:hypothetical protein B0H16DRAFT_1551335 [Mycena metata]|uniref:Uncharacterized protein n=1 Tax=Mycena metata TaxID=1033252 RepID=A0AAD7IS73_9AGAR|nr:hypothetical protein B0H16DRAFT_1551335 [Mycena metata]